MRTQEILGVASLEAGLIFSYHYLQVLPFATGRDHIANIVVLVVIALCYGLSASTWHFTLGSKSIPKCFCCVLAGITIFYAVCHFVGLMVER